MLIKSQYQREGIQGEMEVETALVNQAQSGSAEAFNEIVRRKRRRVLGTVYHLLGDPADVEDVGQDVFVRMFRSLAQLHSPEVFESWLYRLTVNTVYDHLRKRRRRIETPLSALHEEQVHHLDATESSRLFDREEQSKENRELLGRLLDDIPAGDRCLLLLKEVEGLSLSELEQLYGVRANALKVRLFRARKRALQAFERVELNAGSRRSPGRSADALPTETPQPALAVS